MKLRIPVSGTGHTRRIAVQDETLIPPRSEMDLPMYTIYPSLDRASKQWMTVPTILQKDVFIGRTLVKDQANDVMIRIINASERPIMLTKGRSCPLEEIIPVNENSNEEQGNERIDKDSLANLMKNVDESVPQEHREELKQLIEQYSSAFSLGEWDLGYTEMIKHKIDTGNELPVRQRLRRQPMSRLAEIDDKVQEMLQHNIIEPSCSEWSSNVVIVKKKDGSLRFCIDYRAVNLKTRKDVFPLPLISESLDLLSGAKWYSTFDLRAGYHQMALDPHDAHKTTFLTRRGSYQFRVLPFGLCNAPSGFSRLMSLVMSGLSYEICLIYLDDIIIFSSTLQEHMIRLEIIFIRLIRANLKLKPSKCFLLQKKVLFLGHIVSEEGVATDPTKIEAVKNWPTPKTVRDVRSFIGLCSYYRKFIQGFAEVARPLHAMTKKNLRFHWTQECENAFQELKFQLTNTPILGLPRDDGQYILDTDASGDSIGAVLSQEQDGEERVLCYASRLCSIAERNYGVTRREMLAVVYFLKFFRQYLLGRHFLIRSDHAALQWLRRTPEPIGQQARWVEQLEEYDFVLKHRPGVRHGNADALSRYPREDSDVNSFGHHMTRHRQKNEVEIISCPSIDTNIVSSSQPSSPKSDVTVCVKKNKGDGSKVKKTKKTVNKNIEEKIAVVESTEELESMMEDDDLESDILSKDDKQSPSLQSNLGNKPERSSYVRSLRMESITPPTIAELLTQDLHLTPITKMHAEEVVEFDSDSDDSTLKVIKEAHEILREDVQPGCSFMEPIVTVRQSCTPLQDEVEQELEEINKNVVAQNVDGVGISDVGISGSVQSIPVETSKIVLSDGVDNNNIAAPKVVVVESSEAGVSEPVQPISVGSSEIVSAVGVDKDEFSTLAQTRLLQLLSQTVDMATRFNPTMVNARDILVSPPKVSRVSRITIIPSNSQPSVPPEIPVVVGRPQINPIAGHNVFLKSRWMDRMNCVANLVATELMNLDGTITEEELQMKVRSELLNHETTGDELKGLIAGMFYSKQQPLLAHWCWVKLGGESTCLYDNFKVDRVKWGFKPSAVVGDATVSVSHGLELPVVKPRSKMMKKRRSTSLENLKLLVVLGTNEILKMGPDVTHAELYLKIWMQVKSLHYGDDILRAVVFGLLSLPQFPYLLGMLFTEFPPKQVKYSWELETLDV